VFTLEPDIADKQSIVARHAQYSRPMAGE